MTVAQPTTVTAVMLTQPINRLPEHIANTNHLSSAKRTVLSKGATFASMGELAKLMNLAATALLALKDPCVNTIKPSREVNQIANCLVITVASVRLVQRILLLSIKLGQICPI